MVDLAVNTRFDSLGEAPLSQAFNEAYVEWLDIYDALLTSTDAETVAAGRAAELAGALARKLGRVAATRVGAAASWQIEAVQYAFVALIDETLLFADWPGQTLWQESPLEFRLFSTRTAGERVPAEIDQLLRGRDPLNRDLANVYLMCLVLGFRGRLRGPGGDGQHEAWRLGLFAFAYQRDPEYKLVGERFERVSAIEPLSLVARRMLPDGFRLGLALALMGLVMVGLGHLFWMDISAKLAPGLVQSGQMNGAAQ